MSNDFFLFVSNIQKTAVETEIIIHEHYVRVPKIYQINNLQALAPISWKATQFTLIYSNFSPNSLTDNMITQSRYALNMQISD